jgi:Kef-type K+ transport system membrane component KefB
MIAALETFEISRVLLDLLIVIVAAKAAAELAERLKTPAVLGEIVAGILIGPHAFGLLNTSLTETSSMLAIVGELGVILLLLQVGMEMDLGELAKVGKASLLVAVIGVVLPFAGGAVVGVATGQDTKTSIFLGAALTATSVGITARVFGDLRALATTEARIVLGAAVADDVLGLVVLTVVVKVVAGGSIGFNTVVGTLGLAVAFLIVTGLAGIRLVPSVLNFVHRQARSSATLAVVAFAIALAFASLAEVAKLAPIIGAFMAGLAFSRSEQHERINRDLAAIGNLFIPVFFLQIGVNVDISAMVKPSVLWLGGLLLAVAVVGKLLAAIGALGTRTDKVLIGIGMIPRGEVGLIFAAIGLSSGVLSSDLYAALLIVVLVSTVVVPPLLRWRVGQNSLRPSAPLRPPTEKPAGGWLTVDDDQILLNGYPAPTESVALALTAAHLAPNARPSDGLLDWFGEHHSEELTWDVDNTPALVQLLRNSDPRSWRLLEISSVLDRALPEVAVALAHRRADPSELDPSRALRFPTVDELQLISGPRSKDTRARSEVELLIEPTHALYTALALDVCGPSDNGSCSSDLVARLAGPDTGQRIAQAIGDGLLLRANSGNTDRLDEREVLQLAAHLHTEDQARLAYTAAVLVDHLPTWHRESLDTLFDLVLEALAHPEIVGSDADTLAAARREAAQRLTTGQAAIERLTFAPNAYLLSHDPVELARQVRMIEPLPRKGIVRVAVTPEPEADFWRVDVACRDHDGLLARLCQALADQQLDVRDASIATWKDGGVLDSFLVYAKSRPSSRDVALAMEATLRQPIKVEPMPFLELQFDNSILPWHTSCTVTGDDQPGALQAVSAAFATADVVVHSARVETQSRKVHDRFSVSDRHGRKLDETTQERVRAVLSGVRQRRLSRR